MTGKDALGGWDRPLLLIGCGNMAGAILARWLDCGLPPHLVHVVDPARPVPAPGVTVDSILPPNIAQGTMILLGIKPQLLGAIAPDLNARLGEGCTILSILAGLPLDLLRRALPAAGHIVRMMPNLPVRSGQGAVLTYADGADAAVDALLAPLGLIEPLASEAHFDLGTALSGCGPAYVYRFIDALAAAAAGLGLPRDQAERLAVQTVAGAAAAAAQSATTPAAMADAVASPGGMTRVGLDVMDADGRLVALFTDTLRAARDRGAELAAAT